ATRLATARDQAVRAVRDQRELSAGTQGGIKLGTHTFTVNKQPLDLTLVAHGDGLAWQITGTDYLAPAHDARLEALRPFWQQALVSETPQLARAEYLAAEWLESTDWDELLVQLQDDASTAPLDGLRRFAASRYQEGYQRGIHDD